MEQIKKYLPHTIAILVLIGLVSYLGTSYVNEKETHNLQVKTLNEKLETSTKVNAELEKKVAELKIAIEKLNVSRTMETEEVRKADGSSTKKTKVVYTKSSEKTNVEKKDSDTKVQVNTEDETKKSTEVTEVVKQDTKEKTKKSSSTFWGVIGFIGGVALCVGTALSGVPICL